MLVASPRARPVEDHYAEVVKALLAGRLVPVLGTGANLSAGDGRGIPGLDEIAAYLADCFDYPPDTPRPRPRLRVRRADEGRRPALRRAPRPARPRLRAGPGASRCSPRWPALLRRAGRPTPADRDDELRPRARAGVRRGGRGARRRLVHRARTAPRPLPPRLGRRRGRRSSRCRTPTRASRSTSGP